MKREGRGEEGGLAKETRGTCITNWRNKDWSEISFIEGFIDYLNKFSRRRSE